MYVFSAILNNSEIHLAVGIKALMERPGLKKILIYQNGSYHMPLFV